MFAYDEGPQVIKSRLYKVKTMNGISSLKVPLAMVHCIMLLCQNHVGAERPKLAKIYQLGGIVGTPIMMLISMFLNLHMYYKLVNMAQHVRDEVGMPNLKLDFSEIVHYTMTVRCKWNKKIAWMLCFIADFLVICANFFSISSHLMFAFTEFCHVCNRYGNDFNPRQVSWIFLIPGFFFSLVGNLNGLATFATLSACGMIYSYLTICSDCIGGIFNIARTKLLPRNFGDMMKVSITSYTAQSVFYVAFVTRNEAKSEEDHDKKWGSFVISNLVLVGLHIIVPTMHMLKYGSEYHAFLEKTDNSVELVQLIMASVNVVSCAVRFYIPFHIMFPGILPVVGGKQIICAEVMFKFIMCLFSVFCSYIINHLPLTPMIVDVTRPLLCLSFPIVLEHCCPDEMRFSKKFCNYILFTVGVLLSILTVLVKVTNI